jgi:alkanesulfonate monooxygenase SsuD/methylene tetrahydromethanopterin reductase-like flavin-dependent oxidoreductase (luciferase family)
MPVPLSVLDLSPIPAGGDAATALRNTVDLAQHAEQWGYRRYWLAEHHFVAVASSAPAVVIGRLAAATDHIRVGSAAVQLGHTTTVAAVEAFGTLEALYPGRIDLGIGRSGPSRRDPNAPAREKPQLSTEWRDVDGVVVPPPFDVASVIGSPRFKAGQRALRYPEAVTPDFDVQVDDILAMLEDTYTVDGVGLRTVPGARSALRPWVFGSTRGQSARVAGARGLPFVASYHITPATALDAVTEYRNAFRPSRDLCEPYVVVSADVVVADDTATAKHLASSYGHWVHSIRAGGGAVPYPDPDTATPLTEEQSALVADRIASQFVGDADEVADRLDALQRVTGADELVVTSVTHRHDDRLRSHELLAKRWGG